jgi:hypothetical protein
LADAVPAPQSLVITKTLPWFSSLVSIMPTLSISGRLLPLVVANLKLLDDLNIVSNAGEVGVYMNNVMAEALGNHSTSGEIRSGVMSGAAHQS